MDPSRLNSLPTRRFSDRVAFYVRSRPGYPLAVMDFFKTEFHLSPGQVVADIGSGTGILTRLFLENGNIVHGIEPNADMRAAGEAFLRDYPNFRSGDGTAEATGLPDSSVDLVVAAQAFHWFDPVAARAEFQRILRPDGVVGLIWNERRHDDHSFSRDYRNLIHKHGTDQQAVHSLDGKLAGTDAIERFFGSTGHVTRQFPNNQLLDLEGLIDRLASASYMPLPGSADYPRLLEDIQRVFHAHTADGRVTLTYDTRVYAGKLPPRVPWDQKEAARTPLPR